MVKISIIVPVYNVEEYLPRCIDSILAQTFVDFELILVNDGSSDSCPNICDKYASEDSRILVIHQKNGGLSSARNAGLVVAKGTYIGFVDSDDWIEKDMYEYLYDLITVRNAEIVECDYKIIYSDGVDSRNSGEIVECTNIEALEHYLEGRYFRTVVWNKLYKKEILTNITFPVGKLYEDGYFTYKVFYECNKIVYANSPKYNYDNTRQNNIMSQVFNERYISDGLYSSKERLEFFKDKKLNELIRKSEKLYFNQMLEYYFLTRKNNISNMNYHLMNFQKEIKENFPRLVTSSLPYKTKLKFLLFRISPNIYYKLLDIKRW